jgi:hypothetical protein
MFLKNIHEKCQIVINNEFDLHAAVVAFIRKKYPNVFIVPSLGELQDCPSKRATAWKKGYRGGTPDLLILHPNEEYNGLAIELKTPLGNGRLSSKQESCIIDLDNRCNFRTLVSNDYTEIILFIVDYMKLD